MTLIEEVAAWQRERDLERLHRARHVIAVYPQRARVQARTDRLARLDAQITRCPKCDALTLGRHECRKGRR